MEGIFSVNIISFRLLRVISFVCSPCKESQHQLPADISLKGEHRKQTHSVRANAMWSVSLLHWSVAQRYITQPRKNKILLWPEEKVHPQQNLQPALCILICLCFPSAYTRSLSKDFYFPRNQIHNIFSMKNVKHLLGF